MQCNALGNRPWLQRGCNNFAPSMIRLPPDKDRKECYICIYFKHTGGPCMVSICPDQCYSTPNAITPLHLRLEMISSHLLCTSAQLWICMQAAGHSILSVTDNMGNTPAQCAKNGNHHMLCHYLTMEGRKLAMRAAPHNPLVGLFMQMHFAPIIWIACLTTITVFFLKVVGRIPGDPRPLNWMMICSGIILISFSFGLVLMALVNVSDPGYIPKRGERSRQRGRGYTALNDSENLDCPALWAGNWEQLCVTCKIVRPLRAKHDPVSNRCIEVGHPPRTCS